VQQRVGTLVETRRVRSQTPHACGQESGFVGGQFLCGAHFHNSSRVKLGLDDDQLAVDAVLDLHKLFVLPDSTMRPSSMTKMRSEFFRVDSRCAMAMVVLPLHRWTRGFLDLLLGFGIDRTRGLVEDEDSRIAEKRPGNADALPLAAREPAPRSPSWCRRPRDAG